MADRVWIGVQTLLEVIRHRAAFAQRQDGVESGHRARSQEPIEPLHSSARRNLDPALIVPQRRQTGLPHGAFQFLRRARESRPQRAAGFIRKPGHATPEGAEDRAERIHAVDDKGENAVAR